MEENRKKEKRKILPKKTLFWSFFEKCAKENSKTLFFTIIFCQLQEQQQGE